MRRLDPNQVVRDRHAESRVHAPAAGRIPDRGRPRRQRDDDRRAQGPGRGLRRRRVVRHRRAPAVSLHRHGPARVPVRRRATCRRVRSLVERPRPPLRQLGLRPLRVAGRGRLPGPRRERHLARRRDLRQRVDSRVASPPAGRRIATAIGRGWTRGAGRGWTTRPGASPYPITAAGRTCAERGAGCPAPCATRAYYAPALVAFVGGSNFQLTIASGNVGGVAWFPLGPREVYRPSYPVSRGYFENVNRSNTIDQHHRHQQLLQQHERDQRRLRQSAGAGRRRRRADDGVRAVAAGLPGGGPRDPGSGRAARLSRSSPPSRRPSVACAAPPRRAASRRPRVFDRPVVARTAPPATRAASPRSSRNSPRSPASRWTTPRARRCAARCSTLRRQGGRARRRRRRRAPARGRHSRAARRHGREEGARRERPAGRSRACRRAFTGDASRGRRAPGAAAKQFTAAGKRRAARTGARVPVRPRIAFRGAETGSAAGRGTDACAAACATRSAAGTSSASASAAARATRSAAGTSSAGASAAACATRSAAGTSSASAGAAGTPRDCARREAARARSVAGRAPGHAFPTRSEGGAGRQGTSTGHRRDQGPEEGRR